MLLEDVVFLPRKVVYVLYMMSEQSIELLLVQIELPSKNVIVLRNLK